MGNLKITKITWCTGPAQRLAAVAVLFLAAGVMSCTENYEDVAKRQLEQSGLDIAKNKCARCHAVGTTDTSTHDKAPPFRDVVTRYPAEHLAESLAEGIVSGHPDMPVFVFQPDEIDAFLAYLNSLGKPKSTQHNWQAVE